MSITLIAAMDRNRTIGIGNKLPWRLPAEMALFTKHTLGKTVVMGRKTFESLPKPLKDRRNVVVTRQSDFASEGCETVHSIEEVLSRFSGEELMVIGGTEIYTQFLPIADKLHLTAVDVEVAGGDAFFPVFNEADWELVESIPHRKDERNLHDFTWQTFKHKNR
ncbi:dihydrofolate reductase [Paenibacillus algorifonticola]|uniref:Dihydrofolate reductase n=1 Tax=Paenibacillus algorifonticola TaxID=684063 RepID=A0A1I2BQ92_9BACL|nr:dihydrofolate reductase [Paenibacillus algorifonticola]SFE58321.1 dihydrofolate reductase [Paenibacillus algorifonticola]